mgnify:CR=1 FL=1
MSVNKEHIDLQTIKDYFEGKLSPEEMHALEMKAQNDPFLYDAMEGYEAHPEGMERIAKLQAQSGGSGSFFGKGTLTVLGIAAVVYITALMIKPEISSTETSLVEAVDTTQYEEVEIVPESIDTFDYAETAEQITPDEIKKSKPLLKDSNEELAQKLEEEESVNEVINIEEEMILENHNELILEDANKSSSIQAPFIYQYDMYVVDYRSIERKNEVINYTRYEFSGLSAEFEDELARENSYDRETNVEVPYMEYLERSMYYFSKGQYKKALNRYVTILEQYPKDLNAHFYGALCYYDMKQYNQALNLFTNLLKFENEIGFIAFRQEAKWYQAKTLLKLNKKKEALVILDEIIVEGLFYSKDAIELKSKL